MRCGLQPWRSPRFLSQEFADRSGGALMLADSVSVYLWRSCVPRWLPEVMPNLSERFLWVEDLILHGKSVNAVNWLTTSANFLECRDFLFIYLFIFDWQNLNLIRRALVFHASTFAPRSPNLSSEARFFTLDHQKVCVSVCVRARECLSPQ